LAESNGTPGRRERRRLELRQRVLESGRELFEERGYDETKVAEICERADVAYGTFFNHFPTKLDLLRALAAGSVQEVAEGLEELTKQGGSINEQLIELFEGGAQGFAGLDSKQRELIVRIQQLAYTESPEDLDRRFHAAFEEFLHRGVEAGRVRGDVPVETLAEVLSATFAQMSLSWARLDDYPVRERAAAAARFLASILKPPSKRKQT
jgi:AcrR family transcriptional regulator